MKTMNYITSDDKELEKIIAESWYALAALAPWGLGEVLLIMAFNNGTIAEYLSSPKDRKAVLASHSYGIYAYKNKKEAKDAVWRYVRLEYKKPLKVAGVFTK